MDTSKLSEADYARLVANYNLIKLGRTIDPRLLERGYSKEQLAELKASMKRTFQEVVSLNIKFTRPLEELRYSQFGYVLSLYRAFKEHNTLPFPGTMSDQPAQTIEIINTIEAVELEFREKEVAEQERQAKRKQSVRR